jgi:hypothetical protein
MDRSSHYPTHPRCPAVPSTLRCNATRDTELSRVVLGSNAFGGIPPVPHWNVIHLALVSRPARGGFIGRGNREAT